MIKVYFDMDGTIYDLYNVENWLKRLREEDETVYQVGTPLVDLGELEKVCGLLRYYGIRFGVISWASKNVEKESIFFKRIERAKKEWIKNNLSFIQEIHILEYGEPKQSIINKSKIVYLIDDDERVLKSWKTEKQRKIINAKDKNIIEELYKLLEEVAKK